MDALHAAIGRIRLDPAHPAARTFSSLIKASLPGPALAAQ